MKKKTVYEIESMLKDINSQKFNLYFDYGFSTIQIRELFEYEKSKVLCAIRCGYITTDMTLSQIREIMKGIYNDHISLMVKIYAHKKYNHNFMKIIRILLEWDFDPIMLEKLLSMDIFTSKEFFVFALITKIDCQDIDGNIRFVKKCKDQVQDLYTAYRPIFSAKNKYTLSQILKSFDQDLYLAKIEYLVSHNDKQI